MSRNETSVQPHLRRVRPSDIWYIEAALNDPDIFPLYGCEGQPIRALAVQVVAEALLTDESALAVPNRLAIATDAGGLTGMVTIDPAPEFPGVSALTLGIWIESRWRSKGIGTWAIEALTAAYRAYDVILASSTRSSHIAEIVLRMGATRISADKFAPAVEAFIFEQAKGQKP